MLSSSSSADFVARRVRRLGWFIAGYPAVVGYRDWTVNVPLWEPIYRLGTRLNNWRAHA